MVDQGVDKMSIQQGLICHLRGMLQANRIHVFKTDILQLDKQFLCRIHKRETARAKFFRGMPQDAL